MDLSWMLDKAVVTLMAGALFVLWGVTAYLRCLDARNRRRLVAVATILSIWMLIVVIRWKVSDGLLRAILWYAYYIPLTIVPLLCLFCAARASGLDRHRRAHIVGCALWCIAIGIVVLVLTNDIHEQVFHFLGTTRSDRGPYAYVWGHRLVIAWSVGCYLAFFAILLAAARRRLKPVVIPVVAVCLAGLVFSLAYGARMPWAAHLNFSLVYGVLVSVALEFCLDFGLIASSRSFTPLFDSLPFDLKVLDRDGRVFRETRMAQPLSDDVCNQIVSLTRSGVVQDKNAVAANTEVAKTPEGIAAAGAVEYQNTRSNPAIFVLASYPDKTFHAWRLAGGIALLTQDTRDLNAITHALAVRQDELRRTNQMLQRRHQTEGLLEELTAEQALMDDVERAISRSMDEITDLLDRLPVSQDCPHQNLPVGPQDEMRRLKKARMLLAYCKRKSSLVLFEAADPELDRARMSLIANELAGDLRAVGIDCAALVKISHPISAHDMSALYDCIYDVAFVAFTCTNPVLMYFLGECGDGSVELRAQLQSQDGDDLTLRHESISLCELLDKRNVAYSLTGGAGTFRLVVSTHGQERSAQ